MSSKFLNDYIEFQVFGRYQLPKVYSFGLEAYGIQIDENKAKPSLSLNNRSELEEQARNQNARSYPHTTNFRDGLDVSLHQK